MARGEVSRAGSLARTGRGIERPKRKKPRAAGLFRQQITSEGDRALTSSAKLDPASALVDAIKLAQRQARPYPLGDLKLNGLCSPASIDGDLMVAWAHRDRKLQADQLVDHGQGSIGPEAGATYVLRLLDDIGSSVLE
ncbi:MAG: hypothetical protein ACREP7_21560, partial [Lysobacter sp.]